MQLSKLINPLLDYLISIDNNPVSEDKSYLSYNLGIPKKWVMTTDLINVTLIKETNELNLIKIEPLDDVEFSIDEFYEYIINLINKNIEIDKKRIDLENKINDLWDKFKDEESKLMDDLYNNINKDNQTKINSEKNETE